MISKMGHKRQKGFLIIGLLVFVTVTGIVIGGISTYLAKQAERSAFQALGIKMAEHSRGVAEWIVDQAGSAMPATYTSPNWLKSNSDCGITTGGAKAYLPCEFTFTSGRFGDNPTTVVTNSGGVTRVVTTWPALSEGGKTKVVGSAIAVDFAEASGRETLKGVVTYTDDNNAVMTATVDVNNGTGIYVKRSGDSMTGSLDMGGNNLNNVGVITATNVNGTTGTFNTVNTTSLNATNGVFTNDVGVGNRVTTNELMADDIQSTGDIGASGTVEGERLLLTGDHIVGGACTTKQVSTTSTGEILSCVSGSWVKAGAAEQHILSGGSSIGGLTAGRRYLVSVYGITANRGTSNATLQSVRVTNSAGATLAATPAKYINWPDGNPPQSATFVVTGPADGIIRGYTDYGSALQMWAVGL